MTMQKVLEQCENLKHILEHKSEELRLQEYLKDLDAQRDDWERRTALFVPLRQRLERGGLALEAGEDYEAIKDLRILRDKNKIRQAALRESMTTARTDLHNAEEALTLAEAEYRDKLTEQTKLQTLTQKVRALDEQIIERREAAVNVKADFEEAERKLRECSTIVEKEQSAVERLEISLREARKFLQLNSVDEKLSSGIAGIQKCFNMYEHAEEKRIALKDSQANAIRQRQKAQSILNDRAALFTDVGHRFAVIEKNYARARSFYESTLKGKSISEWREVCDNSIKRLAELDELYKKFQEEKALQERLKNFQDLKLRMQQETRSLNIRDVEQTGKIHELQTEAAKLEKRAALLRRIEDLDAVRELLQDGIACPLCGSVTHPYTSGAIVPNPEEIHNQLNETNIRLKNLRDELTARQTRAGKLGEEISSVGRDENDIRRQIAELNAEITSQVSIMGLKFGAGISPFEEIDRARQRTRDTLQLARNSADTAETAQRDLKAAGDELDKIRETRSEATRYHQEALFALQREKSEEERIENECKTQEEIVHSLKRELISQIMPYGYKALPDKNPAEIISALEKRMNNWQEGSRRSDELERELSIAHTKMAALRKEKEALRVKREELASRVKAVEAERDSVNQQRIIIFASRNPDDEQSRMNKDVEKLRAQLNERRELRNDKAVKLDKVLTDLHAIETEMARGREELQKHEINFNKKLLALGFKNEDDYAAACLNSDERRDLQNRLRELTQNDLDIKSERENARAHILELQADGINLSSDDITARAIDLSNTLKDLRQRLESTNDEENLRIYDEKVAREFIPAIKNLMLNCGLPEVL